MSDRLLDEVQAAQAKLDDEAKTAMQGRLKELDFRVGVYRHYAGGEYVVFAITLMEDTLDALVHYYSVKHGTRWTRTLSNWQERVYEKLVEGQSVLGPRFEYLRPFTYEEFQLALWR